MSEAKSSARWWFLAHGWPALPIWVFLFFVCLTGTIGHRSRALLTGAAVPLSANNAQHAWRVRGK